MPTPTGQSVTLVRPDGSTLDVHREDAGVLKTLGYREQTPEQESSAAIGAGTEDYYTTPGQKVLTGLEGGLSGLTLGASDLLLNGESTRERALYNPGVRLGTELIGSFGAPVGILGRAAGGLAEGRVLKGALTGAAEGAQFGAGAAVTNSQMSGDPLTVEAVAAGVGFGGLFGGGLGALAGKAGETVERQVVARKALADAAEAQEAHDAVAADKFNTVRTAVSDARTQMDKAVSEAKEIVDSAAEGPKTPEDREATANYRARKASIMQTAGKGKGYLDTLVEEGLVEKSNRAVVRRASKTYGRIVESAADGDFAKVEALMSQFDEHLQYLEENTTKGAPRMKTGTYTPNASASVPTMMTNEMRAKLRGMGMSAEEIANIKPKDAWERINASEPPPPPNPAKETAKADSKAAMEEIAKMSSASKGLEGFPVTPAGLASITSKRAERIGAALDQVVSLKSAEYQGIQDSVKNSVQQLVDHVGLKVDGGPGTQFRAMWEGVRGASKAEGKAAGQAVVDGKSGWFRRRVAEHVAGGVAAKVAAHVGLDGIGRLITYDVAKNMMHGFLGVKGAVLGSIISGVGKWTPRKVGALAKAAPRLYPLTTRLDGTRDSDTRLSPREQMAARVKEIYTAAPNVKDTLYKALQPLDNFHPDLAVGLHSLSVTQFRFLVDQLPKDPGNAYSALKSLWHPDPVATEKFSRYYEVFHDPVAVITRALETHKITPEAAEGLREMWPELYSEFRGRMLERIAHPEVSDKLSYNDQVHLGLMLSLPLHSTMTPQFISSHQQMFTERNQKLPMQPQPGAGGTNGGRPSGSSATAAQKVEQH